MIWYKQRETIAAVIVAAILGFFFGAVSVNANRIVSETSSTESTTTTVAPPPKEPAVPVNLTGTGQLATAKFTLKEGLATAKLTHQGSGHFGVWLMDSDGEKIELLANDSGQPFDGSKAFRVPATGEYLLDVSADGAWTVDITQ